MEGTGGVAIAGTGKGSLGCWGLQCVVAAWDWAETLGLGVEQSQQEGLGCLSELCVLLPGPRTSGHLGEPVGSEIELPVGTDKRGR